MISAVDGWSFEPRGLHVFLHPTDARAAAAIRYVERRRPLYAFDALLRRALESIDARHRVTSVSPIESFLTREGEEAALASIELVRDEQRLLYVVAWTHLDECYAETGGIAVDARWFERTAATVRTLSEHDAHFMARRRRTYRFTPPDGWSSALHGSPFTTRYTAPDGAAQLTVAAAIPIDHDDAIDMLLSAHRGVAVKARPEQPLILSSGLNGRTRELRLSGGRIRLVAAVRDRHFLYPVHLDAREADVWRCRVSFMRVLQSIVPLPHAGVAPLPRLVASGLFTLD